MDEMTQQLIESRQGNRLYKPSYSESSAAVKAEALTSAIDQQMQLLADSQKRGKINLDNLEEVKTTAEKYMKSCKNAKVYPSLMGFAVAAGYGRSTVYRYISDHPDSKTSKYLDQLRSSWAAILSNAGLNRQCSEAVSIFLLKNSGQDLNDRQDISITARPADPLGPAEEQKSLEERYLGLMDDTEDIDL